jgi:hypothetical protein
MKSVVRRGSSGRFSVGFTGVALSAMPASS